MTPRTLCCAATLLLAMLASAPTGAQAPKPAAPPKPKLEPIAETRLLMEGLAQPNLRGLEKLLKDRPAEVEAWTFARGQALLLAETSNLLLLRPPHNTGETAWMQHAVELRDNATALARQLGQRDYNRSLTALAATTSTCNRCHKTFRVPTRIGPDTE
jgi:hypothetical protein